MTSLTTPDVDAGDDYQEQEPENVITIDRADHHARQLKNYASQADEITTTADAEIRRWRYWKEEQLERIEKRTSWHRLSLQMFHVHWFNKTKQGTFSLPSGVTLKRRVQQPEYTRQETVLVDWARSHGYVKTKQVETIDWARIKAEAKRGPGGLYLAGELVPGVAVMDRDPEFSVEVGE